MDFASSTQRKKWLFTTDTLTNEREQVRQIYLAQFKAAIPDINTDADLISPLEESGLLRHYQEKIVAVSVNLKLPRKVLSTSINFLKRFYLKRSCFEYDPQQMVLVCLYLACKAEDCYISAAELGRLVGVPADLLLKLELVLLQGIEFDLQIHSMYRAVEGCLLDFTEWIDKKAVLNKEASESLKAAVNLAADRILLSDAPLLFTPGQLGLSALYSGVVKTHPEFCNRKGDNSEFKSYLEHVGKDHSGVQSAAAAAAAVDLLKTIEAVEGIANESGEFLQHEEVVGIDKKLKSFRKKIAVLAAGKGKKNKA
ncbi:putative Cyclin-H1-1 [Nannochloris sp. 'desiccata']|nr:putative Cyclin-H1-1 [Chlorella desiccata (nom. nud.)]